ncbi:fluoroquinolone transport system permease protein [Paenibacillus uliginis N3/975]|uniref:Fluoroquinolone transport system permease protein n=1 Tax=Paenibacillus uliginis N3/975 TaxID=1313296 RepID=A0A1X7HPS8_9BACL|nr:ABC transporter permease [Paenibacillus uliginis]SMF89727.1 fluoroquinolone transport system permease protein [Paenibacillus uliginis N3/975]
MKHQTTSPLTTLQLRQYGARQFVCSWRQDIKLQLRHHFYTAYLLISLAYLILLNMIPENQQAMWSILLTFSDPSMLGYFFIGGLILLEKGQHIHDNLFVTPYPLGAYIWSKTLSLTCLSLMSSLAIHIGTFGLHRNMIILIIAVMLTSVFFTLVGLGVAVRCHTMNGFFFSSILVSTILVLPVLDTLHIFSSKVFLFFPAGASLLLLQSVFEPVQTIDIVFAVIIMLSWIGIAFIWAHRSLQLLLWGFKKGGLTV